MAALALPAYAVSRAVLFAVAWVTVAVLGSERVTRFHDPQYSAPLQAWLSWDAVHYMRLAADGYPASADAVETGYFPLLPVLLQPAGGEPAAAVALAMLIGFAGVAVVVGLTWQVMGRPSAARVAWVACWWPEAFVLSAVYTEAAFLLAAAGALWAAWRGRILVAGGLAAAAALLRPTGVLVALPLFMLLPAGKARLAALAPVAATAAFAGYLWIHTGTPLAFLVSQAANHSVRPGTLSLLSLRSLNPVDLLGFASLLAAAVLALRLYRMPQLGRWRPVALAFVLLLLLPPLSSGTLSSFGRYAGVAFPLFWAASTVQLRLVAPFAIAASVAVTAASAAGRVVP